MDHEVILLGGELIRIIFGMGKPLEIFTWIKSTFLIMLAVSPQPPSHSVMVLTPRLAHA